MNKLLLLAAFCLQPALSFAQQKDRSTDVAPAPPKTEVGLQLQQYHYNFRWGGYQADQMNFGLGLSARHYFGKHLAMETGASFSFNPGGSMTFTRNGYDLSPKSDRKFAIQIPLMLQYHFGAASQRWRPYVGIGGSLMIDYGHLRQADGPAQRKFMGTVMVRGEAGLRYQVNDRLSVNISVFGARGINNSGTLFGGQIGLGFRLK